MISVCIATYNGEKFIKEQITSILIQLSEDDEIVVSDDLSVDNTVGIIEALNDPRIRIIKNREQHGYTPNFENAIKHAKGEYIFLSDQDDIWGENKISRCMELFQKYDFIISDAELVDSQGKKIASSFFDTRKSKPGLLNNLIRFSYLGCCIAFKRCVLQKALPFPPNHQYCTHDNWLSIVGMSFYKTIVTNDKLIYYRRHESNTSTGGFKKVTTIRFMIIYRLYLIKWLLIRMLSK